MKAENRTRRAHTRALATLTADPAFAGAWYDPGQDGRLVIAFVGPLGSTSARDALAVLDDAFHPEVRYAEHTRAHLDELAAWVGSRLESDGGPVGPARRPRVDERRNAVVLPVATGDPADAEARLREEYGRPGVVVVRDTAGFRPVYGSTLGFEEPGSTRCHRCGGTHRPPPPGRTCTRRVAGSGA